MFVNQITLQNFRCFAQKTFDFTHNIALIEGGNGSGKTSLLEALHYACYLRSFRTHTPRELICFENNTFFIKVNFEGMQDNALLHNKLHVGYSGKKRVVKLNDKALHSYKDLMDHFRVITVTEDDLGLIKLGPELRRHFIDQAILLYKPGYLELLKEYKSTLDNRNKLLQQQYVNTDMYHIWTEQLWAKSVMIQSERETFLESLSLMVDQMLIYYFPYQIKISFAYRSKGVRYHSWNAFQESIPSLFEQEKRFSRTLFGAHLDDILIDFQGTSSRLFASRGQQKLITLFLKLAQLRTLEKQKGSAIFLLDDFMTDFDAERAEIALNALNELQSQLIFTAPINSSLLGNMLAHRGAQKIEIST